MRVAVVGGGVIGLACAWFLARAGAAVTVLERDEAGGGASAGNTGWVTPVFSGPLPAPGVTRQALRWSLSHTAPFALRPRLDIELARWCWRFWRSASSAQHRAGERVVLALNARTLELYDQLQADGVEFEMHADGILLLFRSRAAQEAELRVLEDAADAGYEGDVIELSGDDARSRDAAVGRGVAGAVYLPAERHVRPETLTAGLAGALRKQGVEVRERTEVTALTRGHRAWNVSTTAGELEADRVVVAAGTATGRLLRGLGVTIRQQPAKGYSVTCTAPSSRMPRQPLYLAEARVSCSPYNDAIRLAGVLELGASDVLVTPARVVSMLASVSPYLRDFDASGPREEWAGLRPLPADGLPIVGAARGPDGLFVATGHGMIGVTLAPATGEALARLVVGDATPPQLEPLRVDRW